MTILSTFLPPQMASFGFNNSHLRDSGQNRPKSYTMVVSVWFSIFSTILDFYYSYVPPSWGLEVEKFKILPSSVILVPIEMCTKKRQNMHLCSI